MTPAIPSGLDPPVRAIKQRTRDPFRRGRAYMGISQKQALTMRIRPVTAVRRLAPLLSDSRPGRVLRLTDNRPIRHV